MFRETSNLLLYSDLGEDSEHIPLVDCPFDSVVSNAHIARLQ